MAAGFEGGQRGRREAEAPQNQRRLQRNRGEGIDGDADRLAVGAARGDHGDAGGELAQRVAQGTAVELDGKRLVHWG
jgi:hypothetical protein